MADLPLIGLSRKFSHFLGQFAFLAAKHDSVEETRIV